MSIKEANDLWNKYQNGSCTAEEKAIIESWLLKYAADNDTLPTEAEMFNASRNIQPDLTLFKEKQTKGHWPLRVAIAAASIIVVLGLGTYFFNNELPPTYTTDINPGGYKATITVGNNKAIQLDSKKSSILIDASKLTYNDGSPVEGAIHTANPDEKITVSTPPGGTYQMILPDGSKVWLNAATTITFPAGLIHRRFRIAAVSGEAYFEIARDKARPFILQSKRQTITVLGTHFNVSAYADDPVVKTTLLEGSIRVHHLQNRVGEDVILKPNQQSILNSSSIQIARVDTDDAIAWKNGEFTFSKEPLGNLMQKMARWYNVEVNFENDALANQIFSGSISRSAKISEVLCVLERTGDIKFQIKGRRVNVIK